MIKFFRHIRQSLIMEHKSSKPASQTGRYFKYAIGEILLVVIGILIALQINNWNQERIDKKVERETLISLKKDLDSALVQIDIKLVQNHTYRTFDSIVLELIHHKTKVPQDSIHKLLLTHIYTPTFDPELGTLIEILSTGKMEIIQNEALRNHISSWNRYMDELNEVDNRLLYLDDHIKTPLYSKYLPYKNSLSYILNPASIYRYVDPLSKSSFETTISSNLYTLEFENLLSNYMIYGRIQQSRLKDLEDKMKAMISIIENYLGRV
jgi:hypothetical protein